MIKVNGIELQVEAKPKLIFMANDPDNKGRSSKTYSIVIANNQHNNEALSGVFSQGYFRTIRFAATYTVMGIEILGSLLINQITKHSARGVFVCGSGNLWQTLEAKNLREFDWDAYDVVLTLANVQASETGGNVIFDVTDRGVFYAQESNISAKIDITERYPAVKLSEIIRQIFNQQSVGLSWHGRQSVIDAIKDKYYLLYTQDRDWRNDSDWKNNAAFDAEGLQIEQENGTDQSGTEKFTYQLEMSSAGLVNPGENWDNVLHEYTAAETGAYRFVCSVGYEFSMRDAADMHPTISFNSVNNRIQTILRVKKGISEIHKKEVIQTVSNGDSAATVVIDTSFIELEKDDVITFEFEFNFDYSFATWSSPYTASINLDNAAGAVASRYYGAGATVKLSEILPDMDSLAFLSACFDALNLNVYYNDETKQVELHTESLDRQDYEIEVFEYSEDLEEIQNVNITFNSDKQATPGDITIEFAGATEQRDVSLNFSRTLLGSSFRLFNNFGVHVSVLWGSGDPLGEVFRPDYEIPSHETKGNLRILEFTGQATGLSYQQTYGGVLATSQAEATTAPIFQEPDYETLHRWQYVGEPVTITARARLNAAQVQGLYFQDYFKAPVVLKNKHREATMAWLETATQVDGDIYELKGRRG